MLRVPSSNLLPTLRELAGFFQFAPNGLDAIVANFLAVMGGVGFACAAIEIPFAHKLGRQSKLPRDAVENLFNRQHPLRPAKTAEGGIGRQISFGDLPAKLDRWDIVRIVEMEQGTIRHRLRQIHGPAAIGIKMDSRRKKQTATIKTNFEPRQKWMSMPGNDHVLIAIEADPHRFSGMSRSQRGQRGGQSRLGFFAPETTAHTRALDDDLVKRLVQHVGHYHLDLRRMLG